MRAIRLMIGLALVLMAGCGSPDAAETSGDESKTTSAAAVMPDLTGLKLDVALSDLKGAGFTDDVSVLGGGTFGVVVESNWTVCAQSPEPGQLLASPELTVDRECRRIGDDNEDPTVDTSAMQPPSSQPQILTVEGSEDFASLLAGPTFGDNVEAFVEKHHLETITFDGYITYVLDSDNVSYSTADVVAGNFGDPTMGPTFRFTPLTMSEISPIQRGDLQVGLNVRVTAVVGSYYSFEKDSFFDPATDTRVVLVEAVLDFR